MIRLLSLTILMLLVAVGHGEDKADDFNARLSFSHRNISLGDIAKNGENVKCKFPFKNSGNAPLVFTYLHASCSCMRLNYPRHPIAPGDSGIISVELNPRTLPAGDFHKGILVRSNAETPRETLSITGKITE